jgi:hypothetical protein
MKINILKKTALKSMLMFGLLATLTAQAQDYIIPVWRGQTGTESAYWNDSSANGNASAPAAFTSAYGGANNAYYVAPGGNALANASLTQTTAGDGTFIIPTVPDGSGDIYSFSDANTFVLNYSDTGNLPTGVGSVLFQTYTEGNPLDYNSIVLTYQLNSTTYTLSPEASVIAGVPNPDEGGDNTVSSWFWNLPTGDDITDFSINFNASDVSLALAGASLDVAEFNTPVPEPGSLALMGMAGLGLVSFRCLRRQRCQPSH